MHGKRKLGMIFLTALLVLSMSACSILPEKEVRRKAPILKVTEKEAFELSYVTRGDMALTQKISCTYVPIQKANLNFAIGGEYVDEIFVKPGDAVQKGDVVGQLRMDGIEDSILSCQHKIETIALEIMHLKEDHEITLKRHKILYAADEKALAEALERADEAYRISLRNLQDTLSIQELTLKSLKEKKQERQLIAPIDGTVTYTRKYEESSVSSTSERAVTIADSTMSLFSANTEYYDYLPAGMEVTITVKKQDYQAVVRDEAELGLPTQERIPGKKAQMYFTLTTPAFDLEDNARGSFIITLDSRTDVLMVPEDAISRANGETIVYVRDEEGMKTYKSVKVGLLANKYYEVLEGLTEGEEVIVG